MVAVGSWFIAYFLLLIMSKSLLASLLAACIKLLSNFLFSTVVIACELLTVVVRVSPWL